LCAFLCSVISDGGACDSVDVDSLSILLKQQLPLLMVC